MTTTADHLFTEAGELIDVSKPAEPTGSYDRYILPDGDKMAGREFTRTTTVSKGLSSKWGLNTWTGWRTLWGLAQRDDLIARLRAVPVDDKNTIKDVAATAALIGGTEAASNLGTAAHSVLQRVDQGEGKETIHPYWHPLVDNYRAALAAKGLTVIPELIERVCRNTWYDIAGRFDNIFAEACGALVMGDKKTKADLDKDPVDPAMQLGIYANSSLLMNYETRQYEPMPNVRKDYAVIVHVDPETFAVEIVRVDIQFGWACVRLAMEQRELSKRKFIITPYIPEGNWVPQPDAVDRLTAAMLNGGRQAAEQVPNGQPDPTRVQEIATATLTEAHARRGFAPPAVAAQAGPVVPLPAQVATMPTQPPATTVGPHPTEHPPPRVVAPGQLAAPVTPSIDAEAEAQEIAEAYARKPKSDLQAYAKRYGITDLAHHKIYIARLIVNERNKRRAQGLPGVIDDEGAPSGGSVPGTPAAGNSHPSSLTEAGLGNPPEEPPGQPVVGPGTDHPVAAITDMTDDNVLAEIQQAKTMGAIGAVWKRWTDTYGPDSWAGEVKEAADARANFIQQQVAQQRAGEPGDVPF